MGFDLFEFGVRLIDYKKVCQHAVPVIVVHMKEVAAKGNIPIKHVGAHECKEALSSSRIANG